MDVGKEIDMTPISDVFGYKDDENSCSSGGSCNDRSRSTLNAEEDESYPEEGLPLLSGTQILSERKLKARKLLEKNEWKIFMRMLNPTIIAQRLYHWFVHSALIVAIPLFIIAFVLFYVCGNPFTPDYIPGNVRFSWWLDFIGRQLLMLELARFSQTVLIDRLLLTTKSVTNVLGPWLTVYCIQSKGWPFILTAWGFWDLVLLEGNSKFKEHWFSFTGLKIYSEANSGTFIIHSDYYLRILFCMIVAGIALSLKATLITIYFGRQMVARYKPRLQVIIDDIITITEVAELSIEADNIANAIGIEQGDSASVDPETNKVTKSASRREGSVCATKWSDVKFQEEHLSSGDSESDELASLGENQSDDSSSKKIDLEFDTPDHQLFRNQKFRGTSTGTSVRLGLKGMLDKWDEPFIKGEKSHDLSIADIMKFRQALSYMDLDYPFSEAFGPASTRNEMLISADVVYRRLMKLCPDSPTLNVSIFDYLLPEHEGDNESKRRRLKNKFHPDSEGGIPHVTFIQACDTLYRELRLFRASVGTSSVIDTVLESIIDPIFLFCLTTIILVILEFNPMAMLVPISSLLLAGSFAFGSSCAKAFEGIILIVGRRPYGIGDRIVIQDSAGAPVPEMNMSWIVEDISLLRTTLRFGATNEIAQVSNGSIANARITNCHRSEKAIVSILLHFHMSVHEGSKTIEMFREGVNEYVRGNQNNWDSIIYFRCESIDPNNEEVVYRLSVRSIHSWQVSTRVYRNRGGLQRFCTALSFKLNINYDSPNTRSIMYYGGSLENGKVQDYKARVLKNSNIISISKNEENVLTQAIFKDATNIPAKSTEHDGISVTDSEILTPDTFSENTDTFSERQSKIQTRPRSSPTADDLPPISELPLNDNDRTFLSMLQGSNI
mmetsp:Transcript_3675/g.7531  ORF Transcript_3675/g.7531 Transcript_3675/m.7531 type:complete len:894 (-) Transcript_3675:382-3063(-)